MRNYTIAFMALALLALSAPQLLFGLAAAAAVGCWITGKRAAQPGAATGPRSGGSKRRPMRKLKLQARVAEQCRSENPMMRRHAREVARCLLGVKRGRFERMTQDEVVEALLKAHPLAIGSRD